MQGRFKLRAKLFAILVLLAVLTSVARADLREAEEAGRKFELPAGFRIQAVAAEPLLANPVAFSVDEQGRIFIAETYRFNNAVQDITKNTNWITSDLALRRVSDRERFLTNAFDTNAYILTQHPDVLAALVDTNRDGWMDVRRVLRAERQVTSGIAAGVLARKNFVWFACIPSLLRIENPLATNAVSLRLSTGYGVHIGVTGHDLHGLAIGMDGKLYFSVGDRGFSVQARSGTILNYPDTGGVLRCNLDGSDLEVFATGLRNPQELTFDDLGNLWAGDNDTMGADKSRLIHVVEGADYGWRCSYQHMKGFGPWVQENLWEGKLDGTLPTCGEPAQGPSGFAFYPGTGLPESFNGRFLMCDFPGGIQSFTVEPKGASYVIKDKKRFLWNAWPTDVEFGGDGNFYFSDWVGGWEMPQKGRIYRLTNTNAPASDTAKILQAGFDGKSIDEMIALLDHADLRVRQGCHLILARKSDAKAPLQALAADSTKSRRSRLHAIWALRMHGSIDSATLEKLLADPDAEIRAHSVASASTTVIIKRLKNESPRVRFFAAQALRAKLLLDSYNTLATAAAIEFLEQNADADPYLTHAGVRILSFSSTALQRARNHSSPAVKRAAMLADRSLASASITSYLKDPALVYEAARAINDVPIMAAIPALGALLTNNCPSNIVSRSINANYRVGGPVPAGRIANFAANTNSPLAGRLEALECLAMWQDPPELDRIVGLWRPIPPDIRNRPDVIAIAALDPHWKTFFEDPNAEIVAATLRCVGDLDVKAQATNVMAIFKSQSQPKEVRAAALNVLKDFGDANEAIELGLEDKSLRVEALKMIGTNASVNVTAKALEIAINQADLRTLQAALGALGRLNSTNGLKNLEVPAEARLDFAQAIKAPVSNEMLLTGGDAAEGEKIFREKSEVSCTRCHTVKGNGGTVGPVLDGIGAKQSRDYLLESIGAPNKTIAKGFEAVAITLTDRRIFNGTVTREDETVIEINSPEDGRLIIKKTDIKSTAKTLSAMPEGMDKLLTPSELRDLVEYMATLK